MRFIVIIILSGLLLSCRSTKINKTFTKSTIDSLVNERTDSSGIKKEETTKVVTEETTEGNDLSVEFDVDDTTGTIKPEDFLSPDPPSVITIDTAGTLTIKGKIKSFKIKSNMVKKIVDSTSIVKTDTAKKTTEKTIDLKKDEKVEVVKKDKKGFTFGGSLLLFIFIGAGILLFLYLRRKKSS